MTIRIATRRSALAVAQARLVADAVTRQTGEQAELVPVTTHGDTSRAPLASIGGTGVFVTAIREALLDDVADLAVHSYKDLPTAPAAGLVVAAVPAREDPRDVLVARDGLKLADLPAGASVGTGSPRRAAQLRSVRPDLRVVAIRGNVDTRLKLVARGEVDAVVLARAGLARLGRADEATQVFDVDEMLPAPAQGALAVECLRSRDGLVELVAPLDEPRTRAAVAAERALLAALEAGCSAPVGAYADAQQDQIILRAVVVSADGATSIRMSDSGSLDDPRSLGESLAAAMLAEGASRLMGERQQ